MGFSAAHYSLVTSLIVPTVFHVPINGLGARLKRVWSRGRVAACDRMTDQSLGRSGGLFPGSRATRSCDTLGVKVSRDKTRDTSGDTFPGSRGRRLV